MERPNVPRARVVHLVYYNAVYPKKGQEQRSRSSRGAQLGLTTVTSPGLNPFKSSSECTIYRLQTSPWVAGWDSSALLFISPLFLLVQTSFFLSLSPPAYNREPSLTLNLCFCIPGLVCFFFFLLPSLLGPLLSRSAFSCSGNSAEP